MPLSITEARHEIKILRMIIAASRAFIVKHLFRPANEDDPLAEEGGEEVAVKQQFGTVAAMEDQIITLWRAVVAACNKTELSVGGQTNSIAGWEFWRREIAPKRLAHAREMASRLHGPSNAYPMGDGIVFNISEEYAVDLMNELEQRLCLLDGQLAVANATTFIEVAEATSET
jgi:hypothetical protein